MEAVGGHKKGFKLLRSNSEAIARRARRGFNLSSSSSNAIGQPCKGFNLIEAAIVLAVVGGVIGAIWIAASSIAERRFEQQFLEGLLVLNTNLNTYFTQASPCTGSYLHYSEPELLKNNIYPRQWLEINVGKKLSGPSILLECPVGQSVFFSVTFWHNTGSGKPHSGCASLSNRVTTVGKRFGIKSDYCLGNWGISIPIVRNNF